MGRFILEHEKILFQVKLLFGIIETVEQLTAAKRTYTELLTNGDLRLKVVIVPVVVNVVVELVVMCKSLQDTAFDWRGCCFRCGESCHPKRRREWSMAESSVECESKDATFTRILQATYDKK